MIDAVVLIGAGALAEQCVQALLGVGGKPAWLASFDGSLAPLARRLGIRHVATREEAAAALTGAGCDHLFSVNNPWVLPSPVLAQVRKVAVNFHDSLLPAHAGLHATSWALMAGDRVHGVSWHRMTEQLDAGVLYEQAEFPITAHDTAHTLNLKCLDAGLRTFQSLVARLSRGDVSSRAQRGHRSYHGASARPPAMGVLDFAADAQRAVNLVRGLHFGRTPNPLGTAKFLDADGWVVPQAARCLARSGLPAGTVVSVGPDRLRITTATDDIELTGLNPLRGDDPVPAHRVPGTRMPRWPDDSAARLLAWAHTAARHEPHWVARLGDVSPARHPYVGPGAEDARRIELPRLARRLEDLPSAARPEAALECIAAYLCRLIPEPRFDIGLDDGSVPPELHALCACAPPLRIEPVKGGSVAEFKASLSAAREQLRAVGTYAHDLVHRHPDAAGQANMMAALWPVAVAMGAGATRSGHLQFCVADRPFALVPNSMPPWQAEAIDAQLASVAQAMREASSMPLDAVPLLDAQALDKVLGWGTATTRPLPAVCIHTLIERQVARTPLNCAVRCGDRTLSYSALDAQATQLANLLATRGVRRGDLVVLCVPRCLEMLVALLGILKAGAAYVPIDPATPAQRVRAMVDQSRPAALVTMAGALPLTLPETTVVVRLDADRDLIAAEPTTPRPERSVASPADRAYVIFTSGSTGAPKGVEIEHAGLVNHALAIAESYALDASDRMLCSASISFDVAAEQIFPPLISGGQVVVRPDDLFDSVHRFEAYARQAQITVMVLPTAFWHEWVRGLRQGRLGVPPTLRVLSVGTEKASATHLAEFHRAGPAVRFFQGYGPTETTITCTLYADERETLADGAPIPIGRPLPNVTTYVLDAALQPVPVGVDGELHVGGLGVARGYLGRPDLTAERFIADPWRPGSRMYKTGDVARWQPDGQLRFVGRSDFQVKVNGHRLEPGEVEAVLASHPEIAQCLVTAHLDARGRCTLVGYYVPARGQAAVGGLGAYLLARLPAYMVPTVFMRLDAFALNLNGKVDRSRLPPPQPAAPPVEGMRPRSAEEVIVAQIWAEALASTREIGMDADFFDAGGDSLAVLNVIDDLQTRFGVRLSMADFLADPTIAGLAARLNDSAMETPMVVRLKAGHGTPLFLVSGLTIYLDLARALPADAPVYSILLPVEARVALEGAALPSVQELASMYVDVLQTYLPQGPYALGGISFGGAVAYEMARQLRARGRPARGLALFDTSLPRGRDDTLLARCRGRLTRLWQESGLAGPQGSRAETMEHRRRRAYRIALEDYSRSIVAADEDVVLYAATERAGDRQIAGHGFADLVRGRFVVVTVRGDHLGILRPPAIAGLAAHWAAWLERAEHLSALQPERSPRAVCDPPPPDPGGDDPGSVRSAERVHRV